MATKIAKQWHEYDGVEEFGVTHGGKATVFLYGRSGIGKTTSIRTLMDTVGKENVAILATEMRQYPLLKYKPFILPTPDIPSLTNHLVFLKARLAEGNAPQFAVLDDLTSFCDKMKAAIYAEFPDKNKAYDRWEQYADRSLDILACMRDMDMNWIILCQANPSGQIDGRGEQVMEPEVHGNKLPRRLPGLFDEYFFMNSIQMKDEEKFTRFFQTETIANGTVCKDSMGVLDCFEPPDWGHIFKKLTGKALVKSGGK